jgi:hypothetical protein
MKDHPSSNLYQTLFDHVRCPRCSSTDRCWSRGCRSNRANVNPPRCQVCLLRGSFITDLLFVKVSVHDSSSRLADLIPHVVSYILQYMLSSNNQVAAAAVAAAVTAAVLAQSASCDSMASSLEAIKKDLEAIKGALGISEFEMQAKVI